MAADEKIQSTSKISATEVGQQSPFLQLTAAGRGTSLFADIGFSSDPVLTKDQGKKLHYCG
jgi:hypothetical protein